MSSETFVISQLLGEVGVQRFLDQHWLKQPLHLPGNARSLQKLAPIERVRRWIEETSCDLLVVRDAKLLERKRPTQWAEAEALHAEGYSVMFRQVDQHEPEIGEFGRRLARELGGALNLHVYWSPKGRGSFGWHCDPEEIFLLQLSGTKRVSFRENTVTPAPFIETLGGRKELAQERSPLQEITLEAGDLLYLPGGYWHCVETIESSVTLSVGILAPSLLSLLDHVRAELVRDPQWRARLPALGLAGGISDEERMRIGMDAAATLKSELDQRLSQPVTFFRFLAGHLLRGR